MKIYTFELYKYLKRFTLQFFLIIADCVWDKTVFLNVQDCNPGSNAWHELLNVKVW